MLTQKQRAIASRRLSTPQEAPAPLAGWNTRDPFEVMEPTDAILLDNWFPDFQGLTSRGGSLTFAGGLDSVAPAFFERPSRARMFHRFARRQSRRVPRRFGCGARTPRR